VPPQREQYAKKQTRALAALYFRPGARKQSDEPLHALQEVWYDPKSLLSWFAVRVLYFRRRDAKRVPCVCFARCGGRGGRQTVHLFWWMVAGLRQNKRRSHARPATSHRLRRAKDAWRFAMKNLTRNCSTLAALAFLLTGYAAAGGPPSGAHLSPTECRDLVALKNNNASPTKSQHRSELSALRKAGYNPAPWHDDPNYPANLHAAQRLVDQWVESECK